MNQPIPLRGSSPSVEIIGTEVVVNNLRSTDTTTKDFLEALEPDRRADAAREALEVGAQILRNANNASAANALAHQLRASTDAATATLHQATSAAKESITRELSTTFEKNGRMDTLLDGAVKAFETKLAKKLDPAEASSIAGQLQAALTAAMRVESERLANAIDPDITNSPLGRLVKHIDVATKAQNEQLARILEGIAAKTATRAERARGTAKGYDAEDAIERVLGAYCAPRRHALEVCATTPGAIHKSKAGDFVVAIEPHEENAPPIRIAIEVRDRKAKSARQIKTDLEAALANRGAVAGLLITTDREAVPAGSPSLYFVDDHLLVVVVEQDDDFGIDDTLIHAALDFLRSYARITTRSGSDAQIDPATIRVKIDKARKTMTQFANLKARLTSLGSGVTQARAFVEAMEASLYSSLAEIEAEVEAPSEAA